MHIIRKQIAEVKAKIKSIEEELAQKQQELAELVLKYDKLLS